MLTGPATEVPRNSGHPRFEGKVKGLVRRQGLHEFDPAATLGKRIASLQPFNDETVVPAIPSAWGS